MANSSLELVGITFVMLAAHSVFGGFLVLSMVILLPYMDS